MKYFPHFESQSVTELSVIVICGVFFKVLTLKVAVYFNLKL